MIENSSYFSILPSLKTGIAHSSHAVYSFCLLAITGQAFMRAQVFG